MRYAKQPIYKYDPYKGEKITRKCFWRGLESHLSKDFKVAMIIMFKEQQQKLCLKN